MALSPLLLAGVFVANLMLGGVLVLGVFTLMEQQIRAGALGGLVVGVLVIYAEASIGEQLLNPTVGGMKNLVMLAAIGAVVGVVGTVLVFEPDL